ncbi:hypothetical protein Ciccas_001230 [Cichlidogyrus casuarinus]|uniref:B30.2/SPRY domain-containing protein n=1 Tax=Cichlidogyrus casuarinus TaxID=1844966 RepID=A0ABD2QKM2_9PLAT
MCMFTFQTVRANRAVMLDSYTGGRLYFEVQLLEFSSLDAQWTFGWSLDKLDTQKKQNRNFTRIADIGSDAWSFGLRGRLGSTECFWVQSSRLHSIGHQEEAWKIGDYVGCLLDLDAHRANWTRNGVSMGPTLPLFTIDHNMNNVHEEPDPIESSESEGPWTRQVGVFVPTGVLIPNEEFEYLMEDSEAGSNYLLYPTVSLQDCTARLNFGNTERPPKYVPEGLWLPLSELSTNLLYSSSLDDIHGQVQKQAHSKTCLNSQGIPVVVVRSTKITHTFDKEPKLVYEFLPNFCQDSMFRGGEKCGKQLCDPDSVKKNLAKIPIIPMRSLTLPVMDECINTECQNGIHFWHNPSVRIVKGNWNTLPRVATHSLLINYDAQAGLTHIKYLRKAPEISLLKQVPTKICLEEETADVSEYVVIPKASLVDATDSSDIEPLSTETDFVSAMVASPETNSSIVPWHIIKTEQ